MTTEIQDWMNDENDKTRRNLKPTQKTDAINEAIYKITGINRIETIQSQQCAFKCAEPNFNWNDKISAKEYTISGLCQTCQDKMFG